jgi:hypothetical protein
MPRPPRPGLTSQPSERDELLTAARGQLHAGHHQQQREAATVAMDEVGSVVVNPAIGQHHEGAEENDLLDERSSLLGGKNENCRKLVSAINIIIEKSSLGWSNTIRRYANVL